MKITRVFAITVLLLGCITAVGGVDNSRPTPARQDDWVCTFIRVPCDCYIVVVDIRASDRDTRKRIEAIQAAEAILASNPPPALVAMTNVAKTTYADLKYQGSGPITERQYQFLLPIDRSTDQLDAMKAVAAWFESISWPKDASVTLDDDGPGIRDPEAYRQKVIGEIASRCADLQRTFGEGTRIKVTGLDNPVKVRAAANCMADLNIDYSVEIESK